MVFIHIFGLYPYFRIMEPILIFDGTFSGFLTAVHTALSQSFTQVAFHGNMNRDVLQLFGQNLWVKTDTTKARWVWRDLGLKGTDVQKQVYYSFLHKNKSLLPVLYRYIAGQLNPEMESGEPDRTALAVELETATREVSRERWQLEADMQFQKTVQGVWRCEIRPVHDVLALLSRHCRSRFQADPWVIVDRKRKQSLSSVSGTLVLNTFTGMDQSKGEPVMRQDQGDYGVRISNQASGVPIEGKEIPLRGKRSSQTARTQKNWPESLKQQAV